MVDIAVAGRSFLEEMAQGVRLNPHHPQSMALTSIATSSWRRRMLADGDGPRNSSIIIRRSIRSSSASFDHIIRPALSKLLY
jgi:hypothetical protein